MWEYIYIYIYIERERERYIYIFLIAWIIIDIMVVQDVILVR
jgi:hypothetical protein